MTRRSIENLVLPVLLAVAATAMSTGPLDAQEERGWLGMLVACTGCEYSEAPGAAGWRSFSVAPLVREIAPGGPAERAGVYAGDTIVSIDGVDITNDAGARHFGSLAVGEQVVLGLRRNGRVLNVTLVPGLHGSVFGEWHTLVLHEPGNWDSVRVQLGSVSRDYTNLQKALAEAEEALKRAEVAQTSGEQEQVARALRAKIDSIQRELLVAQARVRLQADSLAMRTLYGQRESERHVDELQATDSREEVQAQRARWTASYQNAVAGARFQQMNEGLATYFDGSDGQGLLLVKTIEGTPAYEAGLREGDVVISVNGVAVGSVAELRKLLSSSKESELVYVRKGKEEKCKITSDK